MERKASPEGDDADALLEAARAGDRHALEAWLQREEQLFRTFARRLCRDRDAAMEVTQESLFAASRALPTFRGETTTRHWLYTIVRSFCGKRRRRRAPEPAAVLSLEQEEVPEEELLDDAPTPAEAAEAHELSAAITFALERLEPSYRAVVLLRDVRGLDAEQTAQVLGIGVRAMKSRLHRARAALQASVAERLPDEEGARGRPS